MNIFLNTVNIFENTKNHMVEENQKGKKDKLRVDMNWVGASCASRVDKQQGLASFVSSVDMELDRGRGKLHVDGGHATRLGQGELCIGGRQTTG